jgi:hypothetical protein
MLTGLSVAITPSSASNKILLKFIYQGVEIMHLSSYNGSTITGYLGSNKLGV